MLKRLIIFLVVTGTSTSISAQWNLSMGAGAAIPVTGYGAVVKTGWLLGAEAAYKFRSSFTLGINAQFTRLQHDKNPADTFQQMRMTLAPVLFTSNYEGFSKGKLQPYVGLGLGIGFYAIQYEVSPTSGKSVNNVSFTFMPRLGIHLATSGNWFPYLETGWVTLADGPPIGFPHSEKATGYVHISAGAQYRFR